MTHYPFNVLFLCTGNSARSIMAEATLNQLTPPGLFQAYSAGSYPKGEPNPLALALMDAEGIPTSGVRSKSWNEFLAPDTPTIHLVITVCDAAAGEQCPLYTGRPMKAHWGVPDPHSAAEFKQAYVALRRRIELFLQLPVATLDRDELLKRIKAIGQV